MPEQVTILFGLFGGLAMFLFGMNAMSEALQKAAGERMKGILRFLTKNPVMGALAGALVTAVLQSSSATTVMVIGFVSAGLVGLPQAISVIFGANIGTTMTAQLIAFRISDYIYPIIFVGFLINFLGRKERTKDIGMVIFSFGLLFEGIEIMSSVMQPLASSPIFTDLMGRVKDIPVLGILLGMGMTLVVQSSSATIAVLQSFASQAGPDGVSSVIGLTGAIPILLGDNIGTTITALLASIGQSRDAKRTALAHSTFNITGSILFAFLIRPFAAFITMISPKGPEVQVISRQIANAHTCFNVVMTLIWLPLIPVMVRWVCFVIRDRGQKGEVAGRSRFLDQNVIGQPVAALYLVTEEVRRSITEIRSILDLLRRSVDERENLASLAQALEDVKGILQQTTAYLTKMFSQGSLNQSQAEETSGLFSVVSSLDRLLDRGIEICGQLEGMRQQGQTFSPEAAEELQKCIRAVQNLFSDSTAMLDPADSDTGAEAQKITKQKNRLRKSLKTFNKNHLARIKSGTCTPEMTKVYSDLLYALDRMGDNCVAIAEEALDHVRVQLPDQGI